MNDWPVISENPAIQAAYVAMREDGQSHSLAEMFAYQCPPSSNTDVEFMHGTELSGGKKYISQLAEFSNDPRAIVSGKSDVIRRCNEIGANCTGLVKVNNDGHPLRAPKPAIPLADDLINDRIRYYNRTEPGFKKKKKAEKREIVLDRHAKR